MIENRFKIYLFQIIIVKIDNWRNWGYLNVLCFNYRFMFYLCKLYEEDVCNYNKSKQE